MELPDYHPRPLAPGGDKKLVDEANDKVLTFIRKQMK